MADIESIAYAVDPPTPTLPALRRERLKNTILGMPQLGVNGLSENWLLKEAGSMHWSLICHEVGQDASEIFDGFGNRLYASFIASELCSTALADFEEDERIELRTTIEQLSRLRFASTTKVRSLANPYRTATLSLSSIFMRRKHTNDNHSLASAPPCLGGDTGGEDFSSTGQLASFIERNNKLRDSAAGFLGRMQSSAARSIDYEICPLTDFNGAGLLYFANFQSIIDRCEWSLFPEWRGQPMATRRRSISYLGNVNADDSLRLCFLPDAVGQANRAHDCLVFRKSDSKLVAVSSLERKG